VCFFFFFLWFDVLSVRFLRASKALLIVYAFYYILDNSRPMPARGHEYDETSVGA